MSKAGATDLASPFPTTQWTQVLIANQDNTRASSALNDLCRRYWRPIYAFARFRGCSSHDAEDITQAFFGNVLQSEYLRNVDQEKGKFRTFLIHHFRFFLSNDRRKNRAQKRGGNAIHLPLDIEWAESRLELSDPRLKDPDVYFDRQWALEILRHARSTVAAKYDSQGNGELFKGLKEGLVKTPDAALYSKWETEFDMSPGALRVALHRLRTQFREAIELQIQDTITDESELKEEMRHLRKALGHSLASE